MLLLQTRTSVYDGTGFRTTISVWGILIVMTIITQTYLTHITCKTWRWNPRAVCHELLAPGPRVCDRGGARVTTDTESLRVFPLPESGCMNQRVSFTLDKHTVAVRRFPLATRFLRHEWWRGLELEGVEAVLHSGAFSAGLHSGRSCSFRRRQLLSTSTTLHLFWTSSRPHGGGGGTSRDGVRAWCWCRVRGSALPSNNFPGVSPFAAAPPFMQNLCGAVTATDIAHLNSVLNQSQSKIILSPVFEAKVVVFPLLHEGFYVRKNNQEQDENIVKSNSSK